MESFFYLEALFHSGYYGLRITAVGIAVVIVAEVLVSIGHAVAAIILFKGIELVS